MLSLLIWHTGFSTVSDWLMDYAMTVDADVILIVGRCLDSELLLNFHIWILTNYPYYNQLVFF